MRAADRRRKLHHNLSLIHISFEISALDYTQGLAGSLYRGAIVEFRYSGFKLNKMVTAGVKKVDFTISWLEDWDATNTRPVSYTHLDVYKRQM